MDARILVVGILEGVVLLVYQKPVSVVYTEVKGLLGSVIDQRLLVACSPEAFRNVEINLCCVFFCDISRINVPVSGFVHVNIRVYIEYPSV